MRALDLRWAAHGSPGYSSLVDLRREVLRRPLGLDFTPDQLAAEANQLHLGAWEGKTLLGCLVLRLEREEGDIRMRQVAVSPAAQGTGVGRALVIEAEAEALRRGRTRMTLHARDTAIAFYEKLGYRGEGEMFAEVGIPHRFMAKTLRR